MFLEEIKNSLPILSGRRFLVSNIANKEIPFILNYLTLILPHNLFKVSISNVCYCKDKCYCEHGSFIDIKPDDIKLPSPMIKS